MTMFLLVITVIVGLQIMIALYRVAVGPTVFDRVVAGALIAANGVIMLLLIAFLFDRVDMFADIAIAYALLAFLLPVGLGKYFERTGGR